jgi:hypothetical protein
VAEGVTFAASNGAGGVYVCGSSEGGLGGTSGNNWDAWLALYDGAGTQVWIRQYSTFLMDTVSGAAPDGSGGVYVSGRTAFLSGDAWLARYDGAGNQLWIRSLGSTDDTRSFTVAPDGSGGAYIAGDTAASLGGTSAGSYDAWLAHYDAAGNQLWVRQLGTSSFDSLTAAAADGSGGVYVGGRTEGGSLGGPNLGSWDAWFARYDGAGNQTWIRQIGTAGVDSLTAAAPDGSGGVFLGGATTGDFGAPNAGDLDVWLARYDSAGNQLWVRQSGTAEEDVPLASAPDGSGGVYLGGANGPFDHKYGWLELRDGAGNQSWIRTFSTGTDDHVTGAAPQGGGGVYIAGKTRGNLGGQNTGDYDAWFARWEPGCGTASVASRNAGSNPHSLQASAPVLGSQFTATVDLTTSGHAFALLVTYDGAVDITLGTGQHLLCANVHGSGLLFQAVQPGPLASFSATVPNDVFLCGLQAHMQAIHFGTVRPYALSNAQDLVFGN